MARTPKNTEPEQIPGTVETAPNGIGEGVQIPGAVDGDGNPVPPAATVTIAVDSEAVQAVLAEARELAEQQAARIDELEEAVRLANEALEATNKAVVAGEELILSQQAKIGELEGEIAALTTALEKAGVVIADGPKSGDVIDGAHITAISGETIEVHYANQTRILPLGVKAAAVAAYRGAPVRLTMGRDEDGAVVVTTIERAE